MLILELRIPWTLGRWAHPSFLLRRAEEWRFEGIHSSSNTNSISTLRSANTRSSCESLELWEDGPTLHSFWGGLRSGGLKGFTALVLALLKALIRGGLEEGQIGIGGGWKKVRRWLYEGWKIIGRGSEEDWLEVWDGTMIWITYCRAPWPGWTTGYSGSIYTVLRCSALHYIYKLLIWAGFAWSYSLIIDDRSYLILLLVPEI